MNLTHLKQRFKISDDIPLSHVIFSAASSVVSAIAGLAIQFLITRYFGIDKLGVYAQTYAFSNILITLAVFCMDVCALKHIAENKNNHTQINRTFSSVFLLGIGISIVVCFISIPVVLFSSAIKNEEVRKYLFIFLLALPLASINKIFLSSINGLYRIKGYSVLQIMRYTLVLFLLILIIVFKTEFRYVFWIAFATEATLLVITGFYLYAQKIKFDFSESLKNMRIYLAYTSKLFFLAILTILTSNVDIIITGYFLTNEQVGTIGLPLSVAKGFLMLPAILQLNVNPIVAHKAKEKDFTALGEIFNSVFKRNLVLMLGLGMVALLVYPVIPLYIVKIANPVQNIILFSIILVPIIFMSCYGFLGAFFVMAGAPKYQFYVLISSLLSLVIFEPLLLKFLGVIGGALSIGLPYFTSVAVITYLLRKKYGISLSFKKTAAPAINTPA